MDEFCWSVSRPDYRAPAVRRVHIPKGKGKTRPIGIPTVEDKILQRAVTMVLSEVYEQDFLPCSFGYRPGRSAHRELEALWEETMKMGGGWVLEWISSGSLTAARSALQIETNFPAFDGTGGRTALFR